MSRHLGVSGGSKTRSLMYVCRADLEDEKVKKEYERGYKVLLDFYHQHL